MCFGIRIIPMEVFVGVAVISTFVVHGHGSFHPPVCTWFVFVTTVLIAVADIVSVLGAIMCYLQPLAFYVVSVDDLLIGDGSSVVMWGTIGARRGYCVGQRGFEFLNLVLQNRVVVL